MSPNSKVEQKTISVEFALERATKGALRYQEVAPEGTDPKIGTLYIRKTGLAGEPQRLTVEITVH